MSGRGGRGGGRGAGGGGGRQWKPVPAAQSQSSSHSTPSVQISAEKESEKPVKTAIENTQPTNNSAIEAKENIIASDISIDEIKKRYFEAASALEAKLKLRNENLAAHDARKPLPGNLDSTLKKTSAFISKVKRFSETPKEQLLTEVTKLNLTKFVEEIATSLAEAKLTRVSDINAAVKFASVMHQRYPDFSRMLEVELSRVFSNLDNLPAASEQDKSLPGRIRSSLRLYGELVWVSIFRSADIVIDTIKKLIKAEDFSDSNFVRLSVIVSFFKQFGEEFLGFMSSKQKAELNLISMSMAHKPILIKEEQRESLWKLLKKYFLNINKKLQSIFNEIKRQQRTNKKVEFYKGVIPEANITKVKDLQEVFERLQQNLMSFADALDLKPLELVVEDDDLDEKHLEAKVDLAGSFDPTKSVFDDEDSRIFYENIPILKSFIPAVLLADGSEMPEQKSTPKPSQKGRDYEDEFYDDDDEDSDKLYSAKDAQSATPSSPLDLFLKNLEDVISREEADKLSEQFCYLNNKASRRKLIEFLVTSNRRRSDVLPFYSRLMATLTLCFPEIGSEVVRILKGRFYGALKSKSQYGLESKTRNLRFIGELVKFRVAHHSTAFDIWNFCLNDFSPTAISVMCALLESCGRWLYKNPKTNERCRGNLEKMNNLKTAKFLEDHLKMMIENAFFSCIPQERVAIPREVKPLLHEYIRKLIYCDLRVSTIDVITERLLRLSWDEECTYFVRTTFFEIYNVEYSNIPLVANVISRVNRCHTIGVTIVDDIVEEVRYGMELNNYMDSQQRISYVRFLGELYNYGVADFMTVISMLYQLVMFGFEWSKAGVLESKIDSPRDAFRIRLVVTLLETCGRHFRAGIKKKRLDTFLVYFQRYIFLKEVIPVDVEFLVDDLFDTLRPHMERFRNLTICQRKINEIEQEAMKNGGVQDDEEEDDEEEDRVENEPEVDVEIDTKETDGDEDGSDDEEEELEEEETERNSEGRNYDWSSRGLSRRAKGTTEEDEDFLNLLDKTIIEDVESRKYESRAVKNLVDADTLAIQALSKSSKSMSANIRSVSDISSDGTIAIQLLTKKNKGVISRQIGVPSQERLVERMQHKDSSHEEEKQLMKRLVAAGIERVAKEE